ncbi:hypothetical protein [Ralstonia soli]|uniref:Transmembrane protein n=1 Tax=Ralstonia soli TaxID=2953896 RepID=A0ABT1AL43_9RALS|nr:hypothetical protein [Ralstonia soli]MCO5399133.1 hypothetical protein [Ralstonia soli]
MFPDLETIIQGALRDGERSEHGNFILSTVNCASSLVDSLHISGCPSNMRKIAGLMVAFAILASGVSLVLRWHGCEALAAAVQAATPKPAPGAICAADAPHHFKEPDSVKISSVNRPITLEQY